MDEPVASEHFLLQTASAIKDVKWALKDGVIRTEIKLTLFGMVPEKIEMLYRLSQLQGVVDCTLDGMIEAAHPRETQMTMDIVEVAETWTPSVVK